VKKGIHAMRAVRVQEFGAPEGMGIEEVPEPKPGPGQVLIRVKAAGVNPVDTYIRTGNYPLRPELPYTPGFDGAGMVQEIGEGVENFSLKERVWFSTQKMGAYADFALAGESEVRRLPEHLSFSEGACIGIPYRTAFQALFHKAAVRPKETVLIHGASGGVGLAAVQLARGAGLTVIGTAGTERGCHVVQEAGAHHVLNHRDPEHFRSILEKTENKGVSVVLEMLADVNLAKALEILALRGRVVVIGCRGNVEINPRLMMGREATVMGMVIFNASEMENKAIDQGLMGALEKGTLKPVIGAEMPLEGAPKAHHQIMESPACGKLLLIP